MLQETEFPKNNSYIPGNGNPSKASYISRNRNPEKKIYISENGTFTASHTNIYFSKHLLSSLL